MLLSSNTLDPKLQVYADKLQGEWKEVQLGMPADVFLRLCNILGKVLLVIVHITIPVLVSGNLNFH